MKYLAAFSSRKGHDLMNQQIIFSIDCLNLDVVGPKTQQGCEDKLKTDVANHFKIKFRER